MQNSNIFCNKQITSMLFKKIFYIFENTKYLILINTIRAEGINVILEYLIFQFQGYMPS